MSDDPESFQDALRKALKKKPKEDLPFGNYGKIPPQARDIEEVILGAILVEKKAFLDIQDLLEPEMFYTEEHQEIFSACVVLHENSQPIDMITVAEQLRSVGKLEFVGGPLALAELTTRVGSAANIVFHARIVHEKHLARELIRISGEAQEKAFDDTLDVFDTKDKLNEDLAKLDAGINLGGYTSVKEVFAGLIKNKFDNEESNASPIRCGIDLLDGACNGFQPGELIIVAGRPGMGKSIFANNIAITTANKYKIPVGMINLEMSKEQCVERMTAALSDLSATEIRRNEFKNELERNKLFNSKIGDLGIYMNQGSNGELRDVLRIAREMFKNEKIGCLVVDYLQLMSVKDMQNREREISTISRTLKLLALDLKIPIIALSQLGRQVESRGGTKKPLLSDLRESGSIEQDSDMVIMLYRGEYYGFDMDEDGQPTKNVIEFNVEKNRNGDLVSVRGYFNKRTLRFENLDNYAH